MANLFDQYEQASSRPGTSGPSAQRLSEPICVEEYGRPIHYKGGHRTLNARLSRLYVPSFRLPITLNSLANKRAYRVCNTGMQRLELESAFYIEKLAFRIATGFINARLEDDTPIFNKQRLSYTPPDPISHLSICNHYVVMATSSNLLIRIDLENPHLQEELEMPKAVDDQIYQMFLDPTGRHILISMHSTENYYLHRGSKKTKTLGKLKGHHISAVGWNRQNTSDTSTGEILLGTKKGLIFETEISGEDNRFFQASVEQYVKQLLNLGQVKEVPVTGIEFEKMPTSSMTEYRYFAIVTLPGRLYQFIGIIPTSSETPIFQHIFPASKDVPVLRFVDLPESCGYSQLQFYHPKFRGMPKSFAWMTEPGIYYGNIDVSGAAGEDSVTTESKLMRYCLGEDEEGALPIAIVLTQFHVLALFYDRLKVICVLNDQLIFEDTFSNRFGKLVGMCRDPLKGTIWVYSTQALFKYKIVREARDVWQMYLQKGQFDLAKLYCKDNPANMDKVLTKKAEYLFKEERYLESSEMYAQTQNSFEDIALKFIQLEDKAPLKAFLLKKLTSLKINEKTQLTMIVMWLIEIYLNQLGKLKEQGQEVSQEYDKIQDDFRRFICQTRVKDCVNENRSLVYDLIASHGDIEDMIFFAVRMHDFERVIAHHLQYDNYMCALEFLSKQNDIELFYKFSPILMQNVPRETVDAWIAKKDLLDPKKLIPALVQYNHDTNRAQGNEAIRYLEYCVQRLGVRDEAIHNYLLSLYAKLQPDQLLTYLNMQGQMAEQVCYDLKYALRLCAEHDHQRACVHIYSTMALYEEAVHLALQVDVNLAKQNADKPEDDEELRKKLWLKIARHVVEKEKDIKRAMEFLHECDLLKIEDILPFFPDFVTIDHFKDAICTSLQEYNQHIESLKEEMEEATNSAKEIRNEIQGFRNKYSFVKAQDKCSSCGFPLMTRAFYLFPCMHHFHSDCLISEVLPHLTSGKRARVEDLLRKLAARENSHAPSSVHSSTAMPMAKPEQKIKEELDDTVAAECIYCGDIIIRCVDKPFIDDTEYEEVMQGWT